MQAVVLTGMVIAVGAVALAVATRRLQPPGAGSADAPAREVSVAY